jgi:hypothetical protein
MDDLVKREETAVMPFFVGDTDGPTGFENVDSDCVAIPFLRLAQSNTPQFSDPSNKIEGLQPGMYFNPSSGRIYGSDPRLVILGFYRCWNVWFGEPPMARFVRSIPNEEYAKSYSGVTHSETDKDGRTRIVDADGNRYVDTRNFFVMCLDHIEDGVLLYPMTSTGIPPSRKWLSKSSAIKVLNEKGEPVLDNNGVPKQAPMWYRIWKPKVTWQEKKRGKFYQVADFLDGGWLPDEYRPVVQQAFDEVRAYDKARIAAADGKEE